MVLVGTGKRERQEKQARRGQTTEESSYLKKTRKWLVWEVTVMEQRSEPD